MSKTGPSTDCIGGQVLSAPKHLLQLHKAHQRHTTNRHRVRNKGLEQGRPPNSVSKISVSGAYLRVLSITIFRFCHVDERFPKPSLHQIPEDSP